MTPSCIVPSLVMSWNIPDNEHEGLAVEEDDSLLVPSPYLTSTMITTTTTTTTTIVSDNNVHPLDCAAPWMTRSYTSDEFEKFLASQQQQQPDQDQAMFLPKEEVEEVEELGSFLTTFQKPKAKTTSRKACAAASSASTTSGSSKRRGRPAMPAPVSLLAKQQQSTTPASPVSSPVATPLNNREFSPADENTDKYLKMRRSNNEASMKSRLRRKEKEAQNADMVAKLTQENSYLKEQLASLKMEFAQLKSVLEKHL